MESQRVGEAYNNKRSLHIMKNTQLIYDEALVWKGNEKYYQQSRTKVAIQK